jgi:hypothetical protein
MPSRPVTGATSLRIGYFIEWRKSATRKGRQDERWWLNGIRPAFWP